MDRPEDFIGLHFFSPVDKMQLLEIVVGEQTSDEALAKAIDVALQIRKLPIVVNDSRGFFTSRVIGTVVAEARGAGRRGRAGQQRRAGGPAGRLPGRSAGPDRRGEPHPGPEDQEGRPRRPAEAEGVEFAAHPGYAVIEKMVTEHDRGGRAAGAGFYEYAEGKKLGLWAG